ncbi:hypothetical protein NOCA1210061 [metagenome]|uniref:Uncharacterized protein n=1 Tax=metagenome TaxID=256318 RepID=A0A2P2CEK2_9ZZZZ
MPATPNSRCTTLCRVETWNRPKSSACDWWPAARRPSYGVVMPGMNPRTPTTRNAVPTSADAAWTGEPLWVLSVLASVSTCVCSVMVVLLSAPVGRRATVAVPSAARGTRRVPLSPTPTAVALREWRTPRSGVPGIWVLDRPAVERNSP